MNNLFEKLIQIIKQETPSDTNSVDTLMSIIPMSREAAYRRLRNEKSFTFDEVIKIAGHFNISLDSLAESIKNNRYNVQMTCVGSDDLTELYRHSMEEFVIILKKLKTCSNPSISITTNMLLPFSHTFKYETMSKFRLFKWTHRWNDNPVMPKMQNMILPPDISQTENYLFKEMTNIPTNYICIPELIQAYVRDIKHFQKMNLISDEEVLNIKNEAFRLLDDLECDATRGKNQNKAPFHMYLCNSNFDATYFYYGSDKFEIVSTQLFGVGFYFFKDTRIINQMKNWINTLIKDSTLISISGEKQRFDFFRKQRLLVDTL